MKGPLEESVSSIHQFPISLSVMTVPATIQDANTQLAIAYLKTMASQLRFNICGLKDSRLPDADVEDLPSRITENIPDSLQHSSLYWLFLTIIIGGCGKALRNSLEDRAHYSRLKSRALWKWWR